MSGVIDNQLQLVEIDPLIAAWRRRRILTAVWILATI